MQVWMRLMLASAWVALPAIAGQRQQSFRVGAVVIHSARVAAATGARGMRLHLTGRAPVFVQLDSAPPLLSAAAEVLLPHGTTTVTVHY
jgi:hypothetical protein